MPDFCCGSGGRALRIARYRALCNSGMALGQTAAVKPLQTILAQETKTDAALEKLGTQVFADAVKDLETDEKPEMKAKKSK